jgi:phytoene dehydrogenase-like protein
MKYVRIFQISESQQIRIAYIIVIRSKINNYEAIIIGGGLGGLVSGAKLAKEGKKVFLIEQHNIPGGCATTFRRKDYTMEVGLHEMEGLSDEHDPKRMIFDNLGVFDNVDFIRLPEFYRFVSPDIDIVIPDNPEDAIKTLVKAFPEEEKGIKKFFKKIYAIRNEACKTLPLGLPRWKLNMLLPFFPMIYPNLTINIYSILGKFLDSITQNDALKLILAANTGYYHDDPYTMSLIFFSVAQGGFYKSCSFIKNGSQKLSDYLSRAITDNGGKVLLSHLVTGILTEKGMAVGVEYQENKKSSTEKHKAYARAVIANTAIPNIPSMLPESDRKPLINKVNGLNESCSLLAIYIGFRKEIKDLGNKYYSTFVFDESVKKLSDMTDNFHGDFEKRSFIFTDYSQVDSGLAPEGKSVGSICTVDYLPDWENLSEKEYKNRKEEVAQIFFNKLEKLIPGIKNEIECYEVGTPKTIRRYTLNPAGTAYGYAQTPGQAGIFRPHVKSPVKNLYFASAWSVPGGGFTGAILSGWFCANAVLRNLDKKIKHNKNVQ